MLSIFEIFSILALHWIADFVLQTDKQAKGKSKNWSDLLAHTTSYSIIWVPGIVLLCYVTGVELINIRIPFLFFMITFICHTTTDYFTSRVNSKLWAQGDVHNFFVSIGFDQLMHYAQLILTYVYLVR